MCAPLLVYAAIAATSAAMQAKATRDTNKYQAQVAENNAKVSGQLANDAIERGHLAQQAARRRSSQLMGAQRATMAARGLDIGEGSALSILEDTAYFGEVDELTTRANAEREAWGFRVQGTNYMAEAQLRRTQAKNSNPLFAGAMAGASAYFGGGGSLMGNASAVAPRWYGGGISTGGSAGTPYIGNMG